MTTKPKTGLTEERRCLYAALLATSNMGLDLPDAKSVARSRGADLGILMSNFCGHYAETDQMFDDMMGEAKWWYRDLKTYSEERIAETWPDVAKLAGRP